MFLVSISVHACSVTWVVSSSTWPHGLQPATWPCLWDFPGKNTGVGCHFLLQGIFPTRGSNLGFLYWQVDSYHWAIWEASSSMWDLTKTFNIHTSTSILFMMPCVFSETIEPFSTACVFLYEPLLVLPLMFIFLPTVSSRQLRLCLTWTSKFFCLFQFQSPFLILRYLVFVRSTPPLPSILEEKR